MRQQSDEDGEVAFKLTQKLREGTLRDAQRLITTMYLTQAEFKVLTKLPARALRKTRHSAPPFGIDVFDGALTGLVLAEAEFNSPAEASELGLPSFIVSEVTDDTRFTGGSLVTASRNELEKWLAEHGVKLTASGI